MRRLSALIAIAAAALCAGGCEDDARSNEGKGGSIDVGQVEPPNDDDELGVSEAGVPDAGPDMKAPPTPDRGLDAGPEDRSDADVGPDVAVDMAPDGEVGPPAPCVLQATRPCGACADSYEVCEAEGWGPCEPPPEVCNGADDDCDGAVDESFAVGEVCAVGVGLCAAEGTRVCGADGGVVCSATPGPPEPEGCNTLDDDCDGIADEDFGGGQPCTLGIGACAAPGVTVCSQERVYCSGEANPPLEERCNGIDDDCDGTSDEDFGLADVCVVGEGVCRREGVWGCTPAGGVACSEEAGGPLREVCNGLDDDCNGVIDDGFGGDEPCVVGEGVCRREGRIICDADGEFVCSVAPGAPSAELCNGLDDDCDGAADEGFRLGDPCEVGSGACARPAIRVCAADGGAVCPVEPGPPSDEVCNDIDDDCDGEVDEGFPVDERCELQLGTCFSGGRFACGDDGDVYCDAPPIAPGVEICDGADDDCDGAADEGLGVGAPCEVGVGACARVGEMDCGGGPEAAVCDAVPGPPGEEVCNAIDDDCDGAVDEGITLDGVPVGGVCAPGLGVCRAEGTVVCSVDGRPKCDAEPDQPAPVERCDGVDDDCDGRTDEGFDDLGQPCAVGVGACEARGVWVCGGGEAVCSATPGAPAGEVCNGADDDCDGAVDEGITLAGAPLGGRCEVGVGRCLAGGEVVCRGGVAACDAEPGPRGVEVCNGQDDDCDGSSDEGLNLGEACAAGIGACARAGVYICGDGGDARGVVCTASPGDPRVERCDGADDDCDGDTDEDFDDLDEACTVGLGACARDGVRVCGAGGLRTRCGVVPGAPAAEACNDVDDDCDGEVDEGLGLGDDCAEGLGVCRAEGEVVCTDDGAAVCDAVPGAPAVAERCDEADDDCDGAVDEGFRLGAACISGLGICAVEGRRACADDGTAVCDAEPGDPEEEVCDDLDNDCDGIVDEGEGDAAGVAFGGCGPRYRSCLDVLRAGGVESGVYRVSPVDAAGREVYCDQETDGGGWTLVLATAAPPTDGLGVWHADLLGVDPQGERPGVWAGLSHLGDQPFDVRFACRAAAGAVDADGDAAGYGVDVSFYGTPWYRQFIRGGEAVSCFAPPGGDPVLPARRDNLGRGVRAHGQPFPPAAGGRLVGERDCEAPGDFVVDFDDGGLAGSGPAALDGTDWGVVDGQGVCGALTGDGQWLVFAREAIPHPLGPVGLIGLPQLAGPLEAAGFEPRLLDPTDADFADQLDPETLPAVFLGRYADDWPALPAALVCEGLDAYTRDGGGLVTEYDGFSLLGTRLADDFLYRAGAPGVWGWAGALVGGGGARAVDDPMTVVEPDDPITRGLGDVFEAGAGSERFLSINQVHPTIPVPMRTLARFAGDGAGFPADDYPALLRGRRCGANLLVGVFDYADAPLDATVARLVGNLAAAAVSPADVDQDDLCRLGFGGRCQSDDP